MTENSPPKKSPAIEGLSSIKAKKESKVVVNGLRYKTKVAGSPFQTKSNGFCATMSCFKCGAHKPQTELEFKKIIGKNQRVCRDGCRKV